MKRMLTTAALVAFAAVGLGADKPLAWPQFRGPNGTGVADDQKPPIELGPDTNVKWKVAAPPGLSSPIVAGDLIVFTSFEDGKLYTVAYSRADGKQAWKTEAPAKQIERYFKAEGSPAASTPATDGERIVTYFGSCGLFCYDLTGKELWKYEMPTAETAADFGTGTSPIIADGLVILVRDERNGPKILALNVADGSRKWEKPRQSLTSYGTPVIWDAPGGKQIVAGGHGRMIAYDLKTGEEKWSVAGMPSAPCTSPIPMDGAVYFAGWSPGSADEKDGFQLPAFDTIHKQAKAKERDAITKEEAASTMLKDFFGPVDANRDGKVTREEWDTVIKFMAEGKNSAFAVKTDGAGDVTKSHVLWKKTKGLPYVATGIVYRGQFVIVKDGGLVTAYDAKTGNELYVQERELAPGGYYASPVAANGNIYFTALNDGTITVLKAGSPKPEVVVKNPKLGEKTAATPAIADDTMYVRTAGHLYAFAAKK
jgi:outer membrane protein assembly factor BamB